MEDRGGDVCCLLGVPKWCSCQVNILQCTQVVGDKCIRWKSVPLCCCLGKEAVFVVVAEGGYLAVSALEVLVGIYV